MAVNLVLVTYGDKGLDFSLVMSMQIRLTHMYFNLLKKTEIFQYSAKSFVAVYFQQQKIQNKRHNKIVQINLFEKRKPKSYCIYLT